MAVSQRIVVAAQIGIAALVLSIAVLFGLNQLHAAMADPGYDKENLNVVRLRPMGDELSPDAASVLTRRRAVEERLLAIPGVDAVGFGNVAPGALSPDTYLVQALAAAPVEIASQVTRVNPGVALHLPCGLQARPIALNLDALVGEHRLLRLALIVRGLVLRARPLRAAVE